MNVAHRSRPDRRRLRQQVVALKRVAVAAMVQIFAERNHGVARIGQIERRVADRSAAGPSVIDQKRGLMQIAAATEKGRRTDGGIFRLAAAQRHAEGHVRHLGLDAEMFEQCDEIGIGRVVEDDEAGVDGRLAQGSYSP